MQTTRYDERQVIDPNPAPCASSKLLWAGAGGIALALVPGVNYLELAHWLIRPFGASGKGSMQREASHPGDGTCGDPVEPHRPQRDRLGQEPGHAWRLRDVHCCLRVWRMGPAPITDLAAGAALAALLAASGVAQPAPPQSGSEVTVPLQPSISAEDRVHPLRAHLPSDALIARHGVLQRREPAPEARVPR